MGSAATTEPLSAGVAYLDGEYRPIAEATVSVLDWGFSRSDVTYDVVGVVDGAFFRLADHLERFRAAMSALRLDPGLSNKEVAATLHGCVSLSGLNDAYVEMICTRGVPSDAGRDPRQVENRFIAYAIPYLSIAGDTAQDEGLRAVIALTVNRIAPEAVDPTVKNFHWGDLVRGLFEAYDRDADTVILTDPAGDVTEGPGFNVFAVVGGVLRTPQRGVLLGITRRTVFEICDEAGIEWTEGPLPAADLAFADELFVSSTAGGVMPVTELSGKAVGDGQVGPLTTRIRETYWDWHHDPRWIDPVDYDQRPEHRARRES
jgi:branched-chain amino acid aminotransferase